MKIFKSYLLLMKRNLALILLYFGLFVGITIMIQSSVSQTDTTGFSLIQSSITILDRDGGTLAKGLSSYLGQNNTLVDLPDDKDTLRDALYYRKTQFILYIPDNFEENCLNGNEKIGITSVPGSYTESYISYQVDTYLNQVKLYESSGYSLDEAIQNTISLQSVRPNVEIQKGSNAELPNYVYAFRYLPYLFLSTLCYAIGLLLVIFRKEDVKERISCSPVPSSRRTLEMILALSVISLALWFISLLIPLAQSGGNILQDSNLLYYLFNSLLLLLSCMGIAVITGTLVKDSAIITNISTTVSLGISFLCGVFVPLEIMGSNVKKVVQILPVYWYEAINDLLGNYQVLTVSMRSTIYKGYLIQALFAVACVCVAMLISKLQETR